VALAGNLDEKDTVPAKWQPPSVDELAALLPNGAYSVEAFIGRGGMGAVYKGQQLRLQRTVAIKLMRRDDDADAAFVERFEREALVMAKLSHPNIVNVIDCGEAGPGLLYIVMEFVDGTDLMQVIRAGGMTQEMALSLVPQICDALQFAHERGIVHRDIKPSNIVLTREGRIKIADFGLARPVDHGDTRTRTGEGLGTPEYAAPEQLNSGDSVDHRADIYSLGVMLYQMLTGQLPRGAWLPPSKSASVDARWDEIVTQAMQADPGARYETAVALKSSVARIASPAPVSRGRSLRRQKVEALLVFGMPAFALVGIGVAALVSNFRTDKEVSSPPPPPPDDKPLIELNGDLLFRGHRYRFVPGQHSWEFARAQAERMGGHLATITSREEADAIDGAFGRALPERHRSVWIGGFRPDPKGPWQWVTGEKFEFTDWTTGRGDVTVANARTLLWRRTEDRAKLGWLSWQPNDADKSGSESWRGYIVEWESAEMPPLPSAKSPVVAMKDAPFQNSLGMRFVPVTKTSTGAAVLFSIWETRRADYAEFAAQKKDANPDWQKPDGLPEEPQHPVVMMNWEDATLFCQWLTDTERAKGIIGPADIYRLPTDVEWSTAAALAPEPGASPRERAKNLGNFPWGDAWPPPRGSGNYCGEDTPTTAPQLAGSPIPGYTDGFATTAPVGSFAPNVNGLFDMSGNANEWCADLYGPGETRAFVRVLRGGGWFEGTQGNRGLRLGFRYDGESLRRRPGRGFRVVLELAR
jgi:serine/threonine protein kinase